MNHRFLLISSFLLTSFISLCQALNGTYTIGGLSPNYTTFSAAITVLYGIYP